MAPGFFAGSSNVIIKGNKRLIRYADGSESLVNADDDLVHDPGNEPVEDIRMFGRNRIVNTGTGYHVIPVDDDDDDLGSGGIILGDSFRIHRRNGNQDVAYVPRNSRRNDIGSQGSLGSRPTDPGSSSSSRTGWQPQPVSHSCNTPNRPNNHVSPGGPTIFGGLSQKPFRQAMPGQTPIPQQMGGNHRSPVQQLSSHSGYSGRASTQSSTASIVEIRPENNNNAEIESEEREQSDDEGKEEEASSSTNSASGSARTAH
ncbi:hypothetical protein PM082_022142 [Marasmius tenuissimus]|nr:hypothetical protein PM082_022142 [Marasmius tenuissimus]